jgi:putative tryptophan/tyrosine transport system substrate-binding protein
MEVFDVYDEAEFDSSFFKMAREGVGALYVTPDQLLPGRTSCLVALLRNIDTSTSELLVSGHRDRGLMTYGASLTDKHRQAGVYAGRIFKGAKPADLPVFLGQNSISS